MFRKVWISFLRKILSFVRSWFCYCITYHNEPHVSDWPHAKSTMRHAATYTDEELILKSVWPNKISACCVKEFLFYFHGLSRHWRHRGSYKCTCACACACASTCACVHIHIHIHTHKDEFFVRGQNICICVNFGYKSGPLFIKRIDVVPQYLV